MTTLENILQVPRFSDLKLLTPNVNLNTTVSNVEITETPDIANYTSSQTLLLTTAMYYKEKQNELISLIDSLIHIKISGLAIKVGRFITELDPAVIAYADANNFALIEVQSTQPLGGLLQKLTGYINQSKTEQISFALDIQKQFSHLIINDASISKIILEFGNIVESPIILLNSFKEIVAFSQNLVGYPKPLTYFTQQLMEQDAFSSVNENTSKFIGTNAKNQIEAAVYPIKSNNFFPYYLIILSPDKIPYPVSEFAIEQALLVLSFVLLKNEKLEESKKQIKSDYFLNLIERQGSKALDQNNWLTYDTNFGIQFSQFYQIIYVSLNHQDKNSHPMKLNEEKMKLAYLWLDDKLTDYLDHAVVFPEKNSTNFMILLQQKTEASEIERILTKLSKLLQLVLPVDLVFSCGQPCTSIEQISTSLIEAKMTWEERASLDHSKLVLFYLPKGIMNLFDSIHKDEMVYFCKNSLKELAYPVDNMHIELRKTLKTYLDNQCEITKTANQLFIHRNTVKYRIDNCEDIIGFPITTSENSLNLRIALELSE